MTFKTRPPVGGLFYDLAPNVTLYVGGHHIAEAGFISCLCDIRYARVYINYYPSSEDEYINLANMDPGNNRIMLVTTIY